MGDADSMGRVLSMASMTRLAAKTILPSGNGLNREGDAGRPDCDPDTMPNIRLEQEDLQNEQVRVQPFKVWHPSRMKTGLRNHPIGRKVWRTMAPLPSSKMREAESRLPCPRVNDAEVPHCFRPVCAGCIMA
jgi:hypothetical protein